MLCRQKRDSVVWHARGPGSLVCASGGLLLFNWSNIWLCALGCTPGVTWWWWAITFYFCLISEARSSLLKLNLSLVLTLWCLTHKSEQLFLWHWQVQQGHRPTDHKPIYTVHRSLGFPKLHGCTELSAAYPYVSSPGSPETLWSWHTTWLAYGFSVLQWHSS